MPRFTVPYFEFEPRGGKKTTADSAKTNDKTPCWAINEAKPDECVDGATAKFTRVRRRRRRERMSNRLRKIRRYGRGICIGMEERRRRPREESRRSGTRRTYYRKSWMKRKALSLCLIVLSSYTYSAPHPCIATASFEIGRAHV